MNVKLLINENNFIPATGLSSIPSKPDTGKKDSKFSQALDDKHSKLDRHEKPTTDNASMEMPTGWFIDQAARPPERKRCFMVIWLHPQRPY